MLCYRDKSYCLQSNKDFCKENGVAYCINKKCYRHSSEIPADRGEDSFIPICWSNFDCCEDKESVVLD